MLPTTALAVLIVKTTAGFDFMLLLLENTKQKAEGLRACKTNFC